METRYAEMIAWALVQLVFCLCIIETYHIIDRNGHGIRLKVRRTVSSKVYTQDFLVCSFLTIIAGIRCNSGSDYYNYYEMYNKSNVWYSSLKDVFFERFQNGYMAFSYLIKNTLGGEYTIFFVAAIIIYFPTIHMLRKYSDSPVLSFACWAMLGYLPMTMNILKQSIAMVCILGGWFGLLNRRYVWFAILSFLAVYFHLSSLYIIIVMLISSKLKPTKKLFKNVLLIGVFAAVFMNPLLGLASRIVPEQYITYINLALNNQQDVKLRLGGIFVTVFYIVLLYICIKKYEGTDWKHQRLLTMCVMCIPFLFLGSRYYIFNRLAYYGMQFVPYIIPNCFCYETKQGRKKLQMTFFIGLIVFCFIFNILCAENNYYHYGTIFTEEPLPVLSFVQRRR